MFIFDFCDLVTTRHHKGDLWTSFRLYELLEGRPHNFSAAGEFLLGTGNVYWFFWLGRPQRPPLLAKSTSEWLCWGVFLQVLKILGIFDWCLVLAGSYTSEEIWQQADQELESFPSLWLSCWQLPSVLLAPVRNHGRVQLLLRQHRIRPPTAHVFGSTWHRQLLLTISRRLLRTTTEPWTSGIHPLAMSVVPHHSMKLTTKDHLPVTGGPLALRLGWCWLFP